MIKSVKFARRPKPQSLVFSLVVNEKGLAGGRTP
jgi:hypothetical protein